MAILDRFLVKLCQHKKRVKFSNALSNIPNPPKKVFPPNLVSTFNYVRSYMVNSSLRKLIVGGGTGEGGAGRADQLARLLGFLQQLPRPRPRLLLAGAVLCTAGSHTFDWERARQAARDGDHWRDIERCREIRQQTVVCQTCGQRLKIEGAMAGVDYCACPSAPASVYGRSAPGTDWTPFIERKDILVWRREVTGQRGMYEYKMYGDFSDVTADEFLAVQLDMSEFRLSWDRSAAQCGLVDSDPAGPGIVYHWEVNWPRFFSNRDYCCYREHSVAEDGTMLVVSRSTEHPACPARRKTVRVTDYTSVLAIRPHTTSDQTGLEFCLTGFENAGVQLPETIITWVAIRGMPEFMMNLRDACLKLRSKQAPDTVRTPAPAPAFTSNNLQSRMSQTSPAYA